MSQYAAVNFLRANRPPDRPWSDAPESRTGAQVIDSLLYELTTMVDDLDWQIRASARLSGVDLKFRKREIKDAWNQIKGAACLARAVNGGHLPPQLSDRLSVMVKRVLAATGTKAEIRQHSGLE